MRHKPNNYTTVGLWWIKNLYKVDSPAPNIIFVPYKTFCFSFEVFLKVKYYNITKFYQILMKNKKSFLTTFNEWFVF